MVDQNMEKIKTMRTEIQDLKTKAKNFNQKKCPHCQEPLTLPTIHFMCGHTFHDPCIDADEFGQRQCSVCYNDYKDIIDKKDQYDTQAKDPQQFFRDLRGDSKKFHVVAQYFGRGLFSDLNKPDANGNMNQ